MNLKNNVFILPKKGDMKSTLHPKECPFPHIICPYKSAILKISDVLVDISEDILSEN